MAKTSITLEHVWDTAQDIHAIGRRCYLKARKRGDYTLSNGHRSSTLDGLEGLKSLLIRVYIHDVGKLPCYESICKLCDEVLDWP